MKADQIQLSRPPSYLRVSAVICGSFIFFITGCCTPPTKQAYYGPTLHMDQVVQAVNRNNDLIPSIWASTDFSAEVWDKDTSHHVSGSGHLIFRRPGDLLIKGGDLLIGPIFELGSNAETYWLQLIPQVDRAWFGSYANLGAPGVQPLPIDPSMLVEVLGVSTFNPSFLQPPVPVMTFDHDEDAYVFTWNARLADRWVAVKRVTYDRASEQPTHVVLYDENGRTILKADLGEPMTVEVPELPKERWPKVASKYDLFFPESKTRLSLSLSDIALTHGKVPNNATFRMPDSDKWSVKNVINVDQNASQ